MIRAAATMDFARISAIQDRAGALFHGVDMAAVAGGELPTAEQLRVPAADGRLLVATIDGGGPVGFVLTDWVDLHAHLDQVSVDPAFARRGLGQRLIAAAEHWAHQHDASAMTLTTFVDVPWNGPYYRRLGWRDLPVTELGPELAQIREYEVALGLDTWPRTAMIKQLRPEQADTR